MPCIDWTGERGRKLDASKLRVRTAPMWAYSIMAGRIVAGIGGTEILNGTPGVGAINTCAVCKMITLQFPHLLAGGFGRNDVRFSESIHRIM